MKIEFNTYELQDIVLALICHDSNVLKQRPEDVNRLIDVFADLNRLCNADNDYTISLTVDDHSAWMT